MYIFLCRCQKYPNVPDYCKLVKDPSNPCCAVPYCGNPANPNPTIPSQYVPYPVTTPSSLIINPNPNANFNSAAPPSSNVKGECQNCPKTFVTLSPYCPDTFPILSPPHQALFSIRNPTPTSTALTHPALMSKVREKFYYLIIMVFVFFGKI